MTLYAVLKVVHVFAAVIFLGNISVGVLWKTIADLTKDQKIIAHTIKGIILADRIFTIPAVILLLVAGIATALAGHYSIFGTGWILWPLILFVVTGIVFGPTARVQRAMLAIAEGASMDWSAYQQASARWNVGGTIALVLPLIAMVIMIAKPALPAFH
jgi:uncharacterized membrane protein